MKELIKNDVYYFETGYKAGLIDSGKYTEKEVEDLFYKTIEWPNKTGAIITLISLIIFLFTHNYWVLIERRFK